MFGQQKPWPSMATVALYDWKGDVMPDDLVLASSIDPSPTEWLWPDRIPQGCLTLLDGDPGMNKSSLLCDIAARVTTGRPMFGSDVRHAPARVILLEGEDPSSEITRRLVASGADTNGVLILDRLGRNPPEFPRDVDWLERLIQQHQVRFVAIMPVMRFIPASGSSYGTVQRGLAPLIAMAERTGVAVILGRHLNRSGGNNPLHRGMGSMGIIGTVRSGLLVAADPADPAQRVLAQTKPNLNVLAESLSFRPVDRDGAVAIEWLGTSTHSARSLLETTNGQSRSEREEAMYFVFAMLADRAVPASEVYANGTREGFSRRTVRRAMEVLRVEAFRVGFGAGGRHYWRLSEDDATYAQLRERMQADLAAGDRRPDDGVVPEDLGPDDDGPAPDQGGTVAIGGVTPNMDTVPSGGNITIPDIYRLLPGPRALLRRPITPRTPPAERDGVIQNLP